MRMDIKDPTERFLMTIPKPIHDWLSAQAEKLGVTIQDRMRYILSEQKQTSELEKNEDSDIKKELKKTCYEIGKKIYDEFAIERKRLCVKEVSDDGSTLWIDRDNSEDSIIIPVISKNFQPYTTKSKISLYDEKPLETELDKLDICKAAQKLAETENKLLSVCDDGDIVYEAMPFKCFVWFRKGRWDGCFRVCLNSERTPTLADITKVTS